MAILYSLEAAELASKKGQVREVEDSLRRARAGANAVMDIAKALRPLSQHQGPRSDMVDLRQVIEGAVLITSYELRARARITVDVPDELPLLRGDAARLGQVFLNLLLNAAQALPTGAPEQHDVRVSVQVAPDALIARVEDTGQGVPAALVPTLFTPSATSRAVSEGHGMGLAVCRWIVEDAGGTIGYVPRERGACFEIRLPLPAA
jgi:C4-dicarboxylate-specific signal transduction histidine kinase